MADPKKPAPEQDPNKPPTTLSPTPERLTSTGAPVDERFDNPIGSGAPQHLRNAENASQERPKSEAAQRQAPKQEQRQEQKRNHENDDDKSSKKRS